MRKKRPANLAYAVFLLLFITFISLAFVVEKEFPKVHLLPDIIKDIGVVYGSVALLNFLWSKLGGDPLEEQIDELKSYNYLAREAEQSGLVHLYPNTQDIRLVDLIRKSTSEIDICGYTLHDFKENESLLDLLREKIEGGVTVRMIQVAPDNDAFGYSVTNKVAMISLMNDAWQKLQDFRNSLDTKKRSRLILGQLKKGALHVSLRRFDDELYVLHYLYAKNTPESPVFVIKGKEKPLFKTYMLEYETMLSKSEKINQV
jgi:hypothetical protein